MKFAKQLIQWYQTHHRDLPWRHTRDPYAIWISEIILQQTRVNQGLPYYCRFIKQYPTVQDLAAAPQDDVLKLWQGLGYYSRARNLHAAAQQVVNMGAQFPDCYTDLKKLKGIGDYTAAAIASFAYREPVAVVDGNVYRVLARYYGIDTPINQSAGIKQFNKLANTLIDRKKPDLYNQAIMEFGALQCVPKNPNCTQCPIHSDCVAYNLNTINQLPVKLNKTKIQSLHHHYIVVQTPSGHTLLQQQQQQGIWAGLYQFPYLSTSGTLTVSQFRSALLEQDWWYVTRFRESVYQQQPIIHKLSHRKIHAYFWIIDIDQELGDSLPINEVFNKPVPILIDRFIKSHWKCYI